MFHVVSLDLLSEFELLSTVFALVPRWTMVTPFMLMECIILFAFVCTLSTLVKTRCVSFFVDTQTFYHLVFCFANCTHKLCKGQMRVSIFFQLRGKSKLAVTFFVLKVSWSMLLKHVLLWTLQWCHVLLTNSTHYRLVLVFILDMTRQSIKTFCWIAICQAQVAST